uniref:Uncharacterized protein n=1 Tax=Hyaloperonospora arabidopsidis (strain Emoy2) TaxID=559515 RepID=M4B1C2_HYAAE
MGTLETLARWLFFCTRCSRRPSWHTRPGRCDLRARTCPQMTEYSCMSAICLL